MTLNDIYRPALLLACLPLVCACSRTAPAQDPAHDIGSARRNAETLHATLSALPPACTPGTAGQAPQGSWLNAPKAMPEPGQPSTFVELFDAPVGVHDAPAACDFVWLRQDLGGARRVAALRYTFRRSDEVVILADAAIFKSNQGGHHA